jgi:hypothetical protein
MAGLLAMKSYFVSNASRWSNTTVTSQDTCYEYPSPAKWSPVCGVFMWPVLKLREACLGQLTHSSFLRKPETIR